MNTKIKGGAPNIGGLDECAALGVKGNQAPRGRLSEEEKLGIYLERLAVIRWLLNGLNCDLAMSIFVTIAEEIRVMMHVESDEFYCHLGEGARQYQQTMAAAVVGIQKRIGAAPTSEVN